MATEGPLHIAATRKRKLESQDGYEEVKRPKAKDPSSEQDFFAFVSKNETLPELMHFIKNNSVGMRLQCDLLEAFHAKNSEHPIFRDTMCYLVAQALFEENRISEEQRLTLFLYHLALQEFTSWQPVKAQDGHLKDITKKSVKHHFFAEEDPLLDDYLARLHRKINEPSSTLPKSLLMAKKPKEIDILSLRNQITQLTGMEKSLLLVELPQTVKEFLEISDGYPPNLELLNLRSLTDTEQLIVSLAFYTPLFQILPAQNCFAVPSGSTLKLILDRINPNLKIEISPVLGRIGTQTLYEKFHSKFKHPMYFYSVHVNSQYKKIHNSPPTPFGGALHDLLHVYVARFVFSLDEYQFLMNKLLPLLDFVVRYSNDNRYYLRDNSLLGEKLAEEWEVLNDLFLLKGLIPRLLTLHLDSLFQNSQLLKDIYAAIFNMTDSALRSTQETSDLVSLKGQMVTMFNTYKSSHAIQVYNGDPISNVIQQVRHGA